MPPKKNFLKELKNAINQYNNSVSKCQVVLNGRKFDKYEAFQSKLEDKFDGLTQPGRLIKKTSLKKGKLKLSSMVLNQMKLRQPFSTMMFGKMLRRRLSLSSLKN